MDWLTDMKVLIGGASLFAAGLVMAGLSAWHAADPRYGSVFLLGLVLAGVALGVMQHRFKKNNK